MEIYTSVIEANYFGLTLNESFPSTGRETTWLAGLGLIMISSGLYISIVNKKIIPQESLIIKSANEISIKSITYLYFIFFFVDIVVSGIAFFIPAFTQLLIHLSNLKLVFFLLFACCVFLKKKYYSFLFLIASIEFISGLYSFFSNFKIVFIVLAIAFLLNLYKITFRRLLLLSSFFVFAVSTMFYWQIIKGSYRQFLNEGREAIVVNTSFVNSMYKVGELISKIDKEDIDPALKASFRRLGYLEYFSKTVERVPKVIPHENGRLLWQNINFAFIPRILNPNKGIKDDRAKVERYAGYSFWGAGSFSLSYYAEAYVDFGRVGMMAFLFLLGWLVGKLFLFCIRRKDINILLTYSITFVILLPFASYGADAVVLFGQLAWGAVAHLIIFLPIYRFANRLL